MAGTSSCTGTTWSTPRSFPHARGVGYSSRVGGLPHADIRELVTELGGRANARRERWRGLPAAKDKALRFVASELRGSAAAAVLEANRTDVEEARREGPPPMLDRLTMDERRLDGVACRGGGGCSLDPAVASESRTLQSGLRKRVCTFRSASLRWCTRRVQRDGRGGRTLCEERKCDFSVAALRRCVPTSRCRLVREGTETLRSAERRRAAGCSTDREGVSRLASAASSMSTHAAGLA